MKIAGVTDYTNQTPLSISHGRMSKFNSPNMKIYIKDAQKGGAHVQCMNNHFA